MTKQCRKVLKELRKISNSTNDELYFVDGKTHICAPYNRKQFYDYSAYKGEISSIIDWLSRDNYLEYSDNKYSFTLTHKGLHPYHITWDSLKTFLFRSIIIPIVVSIVTTMLLWLIDKILL